MDTKRIYFNIWHIFALIIIACFFAYLLIDTQIHMKERSVVGKDTELTHVQSDTHGKQIQQKAIYQKVNINDAQALAQNIKVVMEDKISVLSMPTVIKEGDNTITVQLEDYTIEAQIREENELAKTDVELLIFRENHMLKEEMIMPVQFVDTQAPQIQLKEQNITIMQDEAFDPNDYVLGVRDNFDDELNYTVNNPMASDEDGWKLGMYEVVYECYDHSQNRAEAILHVQVLPKKITDPVLLSMPNDSKLYQQALTLVGKPYLWGGKGPDAFDCSGIIMYLYQMNQYPLTWSDIHYGNGVSISLDPTSWQIGDVLSYADSSGEIVHHALYLGNKMALHALSSGVDIISIDTGLVASDGYAQKLVRVTRYNEQLAKEK